MKTELETLRRWLAAEADKLSRNYNRHHQTVDLIRAGLDALTELEAEVYRTSAEKAAFDEAAG